MITEINGFAVAAQITNGGDTSRMATPTSDSGEDAAGGMHETVYALKYHISETWPEQTIADRATLLTAIEASPMQAVSVKFLSPVTGTLLTKTCRMVYPASQSLITNEGAGLWTKLSLTFIEN
jgi:hypothetical protein